MADLRTQYLSVVNNVIRLQEELMGVLNSSIKLVAVSAADENFVPSQASLLDQLSNWPDEMFPIPPAAWVQPRKGVVATQEQEWNYVFHGNGVTFTGKSNGEEVGVEFGKNGEIGLTPWIIYSHLTLLCHLVARVVYCELW